MVSSAPELGVQSQEVRKSTLDVDYYSGDSPVLLRRTRAPSGDASWCSLLVAKNAPETNAGLRGIVPTGFERVFPTLRGGYLLSPVPQVLTAASWVDPVQ